MPQEYEINGEPPPTGLGPGVAIHFALKLLTAMRTLDPEFGISIEGNIITAKSSYPHSQLNLQYLAQALVIADGAEPNFDANQAKALQTYYKLILQRAQYQLQRQIRYYESWAAHLISIGKADAARFVSDTYLPKEIEKARKIAATIRELANPGFSFDTASSTTLGDQLLKFNALLPNSTIVQPGFVGQMVEERTKFLQKGDGATPAFTQGINNPEVDLMLLAISEKDKGKSVLIDPNLSDTIRNNPDATILKVRSIFFEVPKVFGAEHLFGQYLDQIIRQRVYTTPKCTHPDVIEFPFSGTNDGKAVPHGMMMIVEFYGADKKQARVTFFNPLGPSYTEDADKAYLSLRNYLTLNGYQVDPKLNVVNNRIQADGETCGLQQARISEFISTAGESKKDANGLINFEEMTKCHPPARGRGTDSDPRIIELKKFQGMVRNISELRLPAFEKCTQDRDQESDEYFWIRDQFNGLMKKLLAIHHSKSQERAAVFAEIAHIKADLKAFVAEKGAGLELNWTKIPECRLFFEEFQRLYSAGELKVINATVQGPDGELKDRDGHTIYIPLLQFKADNPITFPQLVLQILEGKTPELTAERATAAAAVLEERAAITTAAVDPNVLYVGKDEKIFFVTDLEGKWFMLVNAIKAYNDGKAEKDQIKIIYDKATGKERLEIPDNVRFVHGGDATDKGDSDMRIRALFDNTAAHYDALDKPDQIVLVGGNREYIGLRYHQELHKPRILEILKENVKPEWIKPPRPTFAKFVLQDLLKWDEASNGFELSDDELKKLVPDAAAQKTLLEWRDVFKDYKDRNDPNFMRDFNNNEKSNMDADLLAALETFLNAKYKTNDALEFFYLQWMNSATMGRPKTIEFRRGELQIQKWLATPENLAKVQKTGGALDANDNPRDYMSKEQIEEAKIIVVTDAEVLKSFKESQKAHLLRTRIITKAGNPEDGYIPLVHSGMNTSTLTQDGVTHTSVDTLMPVINAVGPSDVEAIYARDYSQDAKPADAPVLYEDILRLSLPNGKTGQDGDTRDGTTISYECWKKSDDEIELSNGKKLAKGTLLPTIEDAAMAAYKSAGCHGLATGHNPTGGSGYGTVAVYKGADGKPFVHVTADVSLNAEFDVERRAQAHAVFEFTGAGKIKSKVGAYSKDFGGNVVTELPEVGAKSSALPADQLYVGKLLYCPDFCNKDAKGHHALDKGLNVIDYGAVVDEAAAGADAAKQYYAWNVLHFEKDGDGKVVKIILQRMDQPAGAPFPSKVNMAIDATTEPNKAEKQAAIDKLITYMKVSPKAEVEAELAAKDAEVLTLSKDDLKWDIELAEESVISKKIFEVLKRKNLAWILYYYHQLAGKSFDKIENYKVLQEILQIIEAKIKAQISGDAVNKLTNREYELLRVAVMVITNNAATITENDLRNVLAMLKISSFENYYDNEHYKKYEAFTLGSLNPDKPDPDVAKPPTPEAAAPTPTPAPAPAPAPAPTPAPAAAVAIPTGATSTKHPPAPPQFDLKKFEAALTDKLTTLNAGMVRKYAVNKQSDGSLQFRATFKTTTGVQDEGHVATISHPTSASGVKSLNLQFTDPKANPDHVVNISKSFVAGIIDGFGMTSSPMKPLTLNFREDGDIEQTKQLCTYMLQEFVANGHKGKITINCGANTAMQQALNAIQQKDPRFKDTLGTTAAAAPSAPSPASAAPPASPTSAAAPKPTGAPPAAGSTAHSALAHASAAAAAARAKKSEADEDKPLKVHGPGSP